MKLDDISKIVNEAEAKYNKETEALKTMTDMDLCEKMISFLEEELDDTQKETSYGDCTSFYTYCEIEEAFEGDAMRCR